MSTIYPKIQSSEKLLSAYPEMESPISDIIVRIIDKGKPSGLLCQYELDVLKRLQWCASRLQHLLIDAEEIDDTDCAAYDLFRVDLLCEYIRDTIDQTWGGVNGKRLREQTAEDVKITAYTADNEIPLELDFSEW